MNSRSEFDVVVIGAGAAGLAALLDLDRAGARAMCLEARDRVGGRILTVHDALSPLPLELGAEFIHGRPPELWDIIRAQGLGVYDVADQAVVVRDGVIQGQEPAREAVNQIMSEMQQAADTGPDEPFENFVNRTSHGNEAKELSTSFVEGFNAARKEIVGIASLAKDQAASEKIDGDRSFRFHCGYDSIPLAILRAIPDARSKLMLSRVVTRIEWRPGWVRIEVQSALTGGTAVFEAKQVVVTVPLGVLQAEPESPGAIAWDPAPEKTLRSASALAFGQVYRAVCRFREAFWERESAFADAGFLLSNAESFPTWWTTLAVRAPILTAWSAGPHTDKLFLSSQAEIRAKALTALARLTDTDRSRIDELVENIYLHDWRKDPFSRGAYSYVPAGKLAEREQLAEPVESTLFFAGEATELNGHSATVHGAIASGRRAAAQILATAKRV